MCAKFQQKILNCKVFGARQSFKMIRQNTWFLENNWLTFCMRFCITQLVLSNYNKITVAVSFFVKLQAFKLFFFNFTSFFRTAFQHNFCRQLLLKVCKIREYCCSDFSSFKKTLHQLSNILD